MKQSKLPSSAAALPMVVKSAITRASHADRRNAKARVTHEHPRSVQAKSVASHSPKRHRAMDGCVVRRGRRLVPLRANAGGSGVEAVSSSPSSSFSSSEAMTECEFLAPPDPSSSSRPLGVGSVDE
eukprot:CAMPEP_0183328264 /NCGR_PEP_ID=MMETSP0160_2-20130417/84192_1 /TAXON_ID=2839 ORGANISM="Odontella Sinensis, Strain Grunow 1884" /NCGR_SAMPLE_ID=MMETSP0160_2 /ASSEMBLY_ACC=CAM_ASM_000250 /LENGTH=125 /DNA_ID=CAMNT_0025496423 /DNA_START=714 /DNA_END=1088 /DNA_ORIENTATION=+